MVKIALLTECLGNTKRKWQSVRQNALTDEHLLNIFQEEHTRFLEQVEIVEKKAASLQEPQNPLDTKNTGLCEHLGPDDRLALEYVIANSLNSLKKTLCEAVESWNNM